MRIQQQCRVQSIFSVLIHVERKYGHELFDRRHGLCLICLTSATTRSIHFGVDSRCGEHANADGWWTPHRIYDCVCRFKHTVALFDRVPGIYVVKCCCTRMSVQPRWKCVCVCSHVVCATNLLYMIGLPYRVAVVCWLLAVRLYSCVRERRRHTIRNSVYGVSATPRACGGHVGLHKSVLIELIWAPMSAVYALHPNWFSDSHS